MCNNIINFKQLSSISSLTILVLFHFFTLIFERSSSCCSPRDNGSNVSSAGRSGDSDLDVLALEERFGSLGFREDWDGRLHVVGWLGRWVLNWDDGLIVRGDGGNCGGRRRAGAWMGERRVHDYTDFEGNRRVITCQHSTS